MRAFNAVHAEPADQVDEPRYRVNFWHWPGVGYGWNLDAFILKGARDVREALEWADRHSAGRRFEVFIETGDDADESFDRPRSGVLIRILGANPNEGR